MAWLSLYNSSLGFDSQCVNWNQLAPFLIAPLFASLPAWLLPLLNQVKSKELKIRHLVGWQPGRQACKQAGRPEKQRTVEDFLFDLIWFGTTFLTYSADLGFCTYRALERKMSAAEFKEAEKIAVRAGLKPKYPGKSLLAGLGDGRGVFWRQSVNCLLRLLAQLVGRNCYSLVQWK